MEDTTKTIIDKITIEHPAPVVISAGKVCRVFYDCIRLTPSDLARLAAEATGHLKEDDFDAVVGIAYTGILFAAAVAVGRDVAIIQTDGVIFGPSLNGKKVLVVDDVVHTGSNLKLAEKQLVGSGANVVGYAAIIDRSGGSVGTDKKPLYSAYQTILE